MPKPKIYCDRKLISLSVPKDIKALFYTAVPAQKRSRLLNKLISEALSQPLPQVAPGKNWVQMQIEIERELCDRLDRRIKGKCKRSHFIVYLIRSYLVKTIDT